MPGAAGGVFRVEEFCAVAGEACAAGCRAERPLMRITFVLAHHNLSGGVRVVATHANKLVERGHKVTIVTRPRPVPTFRKQIKSILQGRGRLSDENTLPSHLDGSRANVHVIDSRREITDKDVPDADVVIATWWETAEWVAKLSPSKGVKVSFIQHDERVFEGQPRDRVAATWRLPAQKIVVSRWLQELARSEFNDGGAILVPCGIDPAVFHAPPRGKQAVPTVGVMYSADHFKGCDISLKAFELARKQVPELRLVAFGATAPQAELPLPSGAAFVVRPPQERIREIYASCDGWLFGSRSEGFGLPLLEAMGCRTPIIATPAGAAPELLAGGGGIPVHPEDSRSMAEAILRLCSMSDNAWRAMSDNANATVSAYTYDQSADLFEKALCAARQVIQS
jgi:glycosyltransferase involved in cell wall biosynthesis